MMPQTISRAAAIRQRVTASPSENTEIRHGKQDRRLAQRRDRGDWRLRHGPYGDPVGASRQRAGDQPDPPFRQHRRHDAAAAYEDHHAAGHDRIGDEQPGRVARRAIRRPGAHAVGQRVGGNEQRGDEGKAYGAPLDRQAVAAAHRHQQRARAEQQDAKDRQTAGNLADQHDAAQAWSAAALRRAPADRSARGRLSRRL